MTSFLVLGDSTTTTFVGEAAPTWAEIVATTTGWTRLNQPVPGTLTSASVSGSSLLRTAPTETAPVAVETFWPRAGVYAPDVAIVALGINDFGEANASWTLDDWDGAWLWLHRQMRKAWPGARIFVVGLPLIFWDTFWDPLIGGPGLPTPRGYAQWADNRDDAVAAMNAVTWYRAFRAHAYEIEIASHMDMTCYTETNGIWNIHPNGTGHQRIAAAVLAAVT